jgi:tagatose 1,6-diphosphate aldolase
MRYVAGSQANPDGQVAYSRAEAIDAFQAAAAASRVPFIYLSAGVSDTVFRESLELAAEAKTPYSGVLCGRATWQDGIAAYAKGGEGALRAWLQDRGVANIQALNAVLDAGARAWWDFYGGREQIAVVGADSRA